MWIYIKHWKQLKMNAQNTPNVWIVLWDWDIAVVELLQMDFRQIGIYKSLLISYLRQKQYMRKNGDRYGK